MEKTEGKTQQALLAEFSFPELYQELRVSAPGHGSQNKNVVFRCKPNYEGGPWYDFVQVLVTDDLDGEPTDLMYAAEILAFVVLQKKNEEHEMMMAFVKFYVSALTYHEAENPYYPGKDLSKVAKNLPFALVHEDPILMARYGLIDTEQIQGGLWVQEDFQTPGRYWVINKGNE